MKIDKLKRKARLCRTRSSKRDVNFFLRQLAEEHSGREMILDILNSKASFIAVEDLRTNEISLINKSEIMFLELEERDLIEEIMLAPEISVQIELISGDMLSGSFYVDTPPERSRLSDYINFSPQFLYLCRKDGDIIINRAYMFAVKEKT